jgi:hypothetical protein
MAEKNQNTIAIFKNADKKSDKSPDYSGSLEINGVKYRTALWLKQSKSGTAFLGGVVDLIEEKKEEVKPSYQPVVNDDLGF